MDKLTIPFETHQPTYVALPPAQHIRTIEVKVKPTQEITLYASTDPPPVEVGQLYKVTEYRKEEEEGIAMWDGWRWVITLTPIDKP